MKGRLVLLALVSSTVFSFCTSNDNHSEKQKESKEEKASVQAATTEQGSFIYDLSKPATTWSLPAELKEISGNAWVDDTHILAIEDLHPTLYLIQLKSDQAVIEKQIPFATAPEKKFDIEDVAVSGNTAYALWSHGDIFKINNWQTKPEVKELNTNLDKKNNTEGLCLDPVSHNLLVACKNESGLEDEKKSARSIYMFDLQKEKLNADPFLVIEKKEFKKLIDEKVEFFPSAVAVHPITHDVYVLSTKDNKCMVQYSYDGKIKAFQFINKDLMPQPEGICFAPDGTLYISTEGKHGEPAKIFRFNSYSK